MMMMTMMTQEPGHNAAVRSMPTPASEVVQAVRDQRSLTSKLIRGLLDPTPQSLVCNSAIVTNNKKSELSQR